MTINGFLAGLVAITCPCYWVSPFGAIMIGAISGPVCALVVDLIEYLRIDDPVGAVAVHGGAGIWGTLSLGLFATGQYGAPTPTGADNSAGAVVTGLFYGGGVNQLIGQAIGSAAIGGATLVGSLLMMYFVKITVGLRVSQGGRARRDRPSRARRRRVSGAGRLVARLRASRGGQGHGGGPGGRSQPGHLGRRFKRGPRVQPGPRSKDGACRAHKPGGGHATRGWFLGRVGVDGAPGQPGAPIPLCARFARFAGGAAPLPRAHPPDRDESRFPDLARHISLRRAKPAFDQPGPRWALFSFLARAPDGALFIWASCSRRPLRRVGGDAGPGPFLKSLG